MTEHEIRFSGHRYPARLIAKQYSDPVDIALFFVDGKVLFPSYHIAYESPAIGEPAWMVGSSRNRNSYRKTNGKIQATRIVGYEYEFNRPAISGDSGGPLFVQGHRVVGVVSATDDRSTLVTTLPKIRTFLTATIGGIPGCRNSKLKPKEPPVKPSPGIDGLLKRIAALEAKLAALEARELLKGDEGPEGKRGLQGEPGPARMITVIIKDTAGKQLTAPVKVPPDKDRVTIPIERFTRKGQ